MPDLHREISIARPSNRPHNFVSAIASCNFVAIAECLLARTQNLCSIRRGSLVCHNCEIAIALLLCHDFSLTLVIHLKPVVAVARSVANAVVISFVVAPVPPTNHLHTAVVGARAEHAIAFAVANSKHAISPIPPFVTSSIFFINQKLSKTLSSYLNLW